jgi:hypothetical protein
MNLKTDFLDKNLIYDLNEIQELFLDSENYQVYLVGHTGLYKEEMLNKMVSILVAQGIENRNIVYLDFTLPFIRSLNIDETLTHFSKQRNLKQKLFLIINEVEMMEDWQNELSKIHTHWTYIKVLCSCSIPHLIHEYFFDNPDDFSKTVVLSTKNTSNTKHKSDTFGVYCDLKYNIKNNVCEIKGMTKEGKSKSKHIIPCKINGFPVKIIASGSFHHSSELAEIEIPDCVEYIGDYTFTQCKKLKSIKLPDNLKYIGECAFLGATNLDLIVGGGKVNHIGNSAFYGTKWLRNNQDIFIFFGKVLYKYNGKEKHINIPLNISTIGSYAFADTYIETINLLNIKTIEEGAFYNCMQLTEIFNYTKKNVKAFQFYNCHSLKQFDKILSRIGAFAFYNCKSLTEIGFYEARIGNNAFECCANLTNSTEKKIIDKGMAINIDSCAFWKTPLQNFIFRNTRNIGKFAFYNTYLKSFDLQQAIRIEDYAFSTMGILNQVQLNENTTLGKAIFINSNNIKKAHLSGKYSLNSYFNEESKIEELHISGEECIDNFSRNNQYLKSLVVRCNKVGNWAFYQNRNLSSVKLKIEEFGAWSFAYCDALTEIEIPKEVKFVEMNCFRYCHNLIKIFLSSEKPILFGANAFYSTAVDKQFFVKNLEEYRKLEIWQEYLSNIKKINDDE